MKKRVWIILLIILCGLALATGGAALAKSKSTITALDVALGEPGLSFRYVEQLGETQVPFLADTEHLVQPNGLFIDADDNVYVTEEYGSRLLKYDSNGENLLAIGNAGMCTYFCSTWDSAVDLTGTFWVADGDRLVQFDMAGTQLQALGRSEDENYRFDGGVRGLALDSAGHLFVSDTWRHRIQVYDLSGGTPVYSTTLGVTDVPSNTLGYFNAPHRLAVDSLDRLLIADRENGRLQRCEYSGIWTCEVMDGDVDYPEGVGVDADDNVYGTDYFNDRVRKCTAPEVCEDLITDTPAGAHDVAIDSSGNIFVSYQYDFSVRKYTNAGVEIEVFAGVEGVPYLTDADHYNHARLEVDDQDNLLIVEEQGHRLLKLDAQGSFVWQFGVAGVQGNDTEHLSWPHGVAVDSQGNVYVADNCRVVIITAAGDFSDALGECGAGEYQFSWPTGIDVAVDGTLYVADYHNHRVQVYDSSLTYVDTLGVTGECVDDNEHLCTPIGVAVDDVGNVYVADAGNERIQKFDSSGNYLLTIGDEQWGDGFGQFNWAEDVEVDAEGRVYVADWSNNRVQVFSPGGAFLTSIGGANGTNSSQFQGVASMAVDSQGNLFVGDWENLRFQVFTPGYPGWQQANINGFGKPWNNNVVSMEIFNEMLYVGTFNWSDGAEIWRTADGKTWQQTNESGFGEENFDHNNAVIDLAVFGDYLYASTGWRGLPGQIWRTADGLTWEQVEDNGFDDPENWDITIFGIFENQLYVSITGSEGVEIWRSSTGEAGDWIRVVENGNGNINNQFITDMIEFEGKFYTMVESIADPKTGLQIWQTTDGETWTAVVSDGFGDPENYQTGGAAIFDGMLYVGTRNEASGAEIWRSVDGVNWNQAASGGLDNVSNVKIENIFVYNGQIFATTSNDSGMQVYSSPDGTNWTRLVENGFGDVNTGWSGWTGLDFKGRLYLGASNDASGAKVWRYNAYRDTFLPFLVK